MNESMTKYNHRMTAEESISNFIGYLEESTGVPVSESNKEWLYTKGLEIFDTYYVDNTITVNLNSEEDRDMLTDYMVDVQTTMGRMFAHIMLVEFRLYLITKNPTIN